MRVLCGTRVVDCTLNRALPARGRGKNILPAMNRCDVVRRFQKCTPLWLRHFQFTQFGFGLFQPSPIGGRIEFEAEVLP